MTELVVKNWSDRHDLAAILKATGSTNQEIAEKLDYEQAYVSRLLKDPRAVEKMKEVASRVADAAEDVAVRLKLLANEALDTAVYWMQKRESELAAVSVRSAFGILDRAGYSKVDKKLVGHFEASPDRLEEMLRLAEKANVVQEEYNYGGREIVVEPSGDGDGTSPGSGGDSS